MGKKQKATLRFFDQVDFFGMKAEFLGTFLVVYFSGWAFMHLHFEKSRGSTDLLGVALVSIFTYGLMTWVAYLYSGAIFNPAILIVLVCFKKVSFSKGLFYLLAQMSASVVAASLLRAIAPEDLIISYSKEAGFLGFPNTDLSFFRVLAYEALGTCLVICTYYTSVLSKRAPKFAYGMTMGMAYGGMVMLFGDKTGAACNPARIFGPAMIEKRYFNLFEYYSGHLAGSLVGAFISEVILLPTAQTGDMLKDKGANLNIKTDLKDEIIGRTGKNSKNATEKARRSTTTTTPPTKRPTTARSRTKTSPKTTSRQDTSPRSTKTKRRSETPTPQQRSRSSRPTRATKRPCRSRRSTKRKKSRTS